MCVDDFSLITFNYRNSLLFNIILIPLWLTSEFLWILFIHYWYLNSDYPFIIFVLPLRTFYLYLLLIMFIHWSVILRRRLLKDWGSFQTLMCRYLLIYQWFLFIPSNIIFRLHWVHQQHYFHDQVHSLRDPLYYHMKMITQSLNLITANGRVLRHAYYMAHKVLIGLYVTLQIFP